MKYTHPKNFLKLGAPLLVGLLFFNNCQKDDFGSQNDPINTINESLYTFKEIGKKEIEGNPSVMEKLNRLLPHETTDAARTVYAEEYGFYVNTDYANYIVSRDSSYHSYTFPILRTARNGLLENLLFSLQDDGSYRIFLVAYELTPREEEDMINGWS